MQTWTKLVISGPSYPVYRRSHTTCFVGRSPQGHPQLIISGGMGEGDVVFGDKWIIDTNEKAGTLFYKEVSKLVCPSVHIICTHVNHNLGGGTK